MTVTTTKTLTVTVVRTAKNLTVSADGGSRGKRELVLDFVKVDKVELSDVQNQVLDHFVDAGFRTRFGTPYEVKATPDQLKTLVTIKELSEGTVSAAKAPAAKTKAPLPAPIDKVTTETVVAGTRRVTRTPERRPTADPAASEAARVEQAEAVIARLNEPQWMLQYDIPDSAEEGNPSWLMWKAGFFRLTKSVWVGSESCTKSPLIETLMSTYRQKGIRAYLIPFAESANAQLRALAQERLREMLVEIHGSLVQRIASAAQFLADGQAAMEADRKRGEEVTSRRQEALADRYDGRMRSALQVAAERLEVAIRFAEMYDHREQVSDLLDGLRSAIRSEAAAFNARALEQDRRAVALPAVVTGA